MSFLKGRTGLKEINFQSFIKGVIILVVLYLFLGVFTTGGIGYTNGQFYNNISFEFGKSFDALTFFISIGIASLAWVIYTYVFSINRISTRRDYFILIAIGLVLIVAFLVWKSPESLIPSFKGSFLDTTVQSFIG